MKIARVRVRGGPVPSLLSESRLPFVALGLVVGGAIALKVAALLVVLMPLVTFFLVQRFGAGMTSVAFVEPGLVRFPLGARLRASDVLALTTARLDDSAAAPITVAIAHRRRPDRALLLDLDSAADAEAIAEALGAGTHGAGHHVTFADPQRGLLGLVLAGAIVLALVAFTHRLPFFVQSAWSQVAFGALGAIAAFVGLGQRASGVRLERTGFVFAGARFAYGAIVGVDVTGASVRVALDNGTTVALAGGTEPRHLAAHLRAAALRARGPVAEEAVAPALLVAPQGDLAGFLERIDAATSGRGTHYRYAGVDRDAALATLHDADQSLVARAAAARVLVGLGDEKDGIAETLATLRSPGATERARIVARLDEADDDATATALEELAALDEADEDAVANGRRSRRGA